MSIDSGCTNHMTFDHDLFKELHTSVISKGQVGNGDYIPTKGKGTVEIKSSSGTRLIKDVFFVPNISHSLLSVGQMLENGFKLLFEINHCQIKDEASKNLFKVMMKGKSFALDPLEHEQKAYSATKINAEVWHKRVGHFKHATVMNLQKKDLVQGLPNLEVEIPNCKTCRSGKQTKLPFKKATWSTTEKLKLIHRDLVGSHRIPSLKGSKYYIVCIDDYTRMCWIYFLKFK